MIFIIFLFDNMSIYYFPIWHYVFLLQRRAFMSFYQVLDVVTGPNRRQCYLRKEISTWCQIRKFKFFNAKCERLICFSAKYIILPWTNSVELDNTDVRQIGWTNCAAVWRIKYDGMNPSSKNSIVPFDEMELMKRNGWFDRSEAPTAVSDSAGRGERRYVTPVGDGKSGPVRV